MGTATFKKVGDVVDYTPSSAVSEGDVIVQGQLVGVALRDIAANTQDALVVAGVITWPKATTSTSALTAGAKVYWDATNEVVTTDSDSGTNIYVGKVVTAAGASAATVDVRFEQ